MSRKGHEIWLRKVFSLAATILLVASTVLVGISLNAPNASAGSLTHDVGDLWVDQLTDYGRILKGFTWNAEPQNFRDPLTGWGYIGLVIDQDNYNHTPGVENIADSYDTWPYGGTDDFDWIFGQTDITMVTDDGTLEKSLAGFRNVGAGTLDPYDIWINQTCWTMVSKDWAILQWTLYNTKGVDITNVAIGLEIPLSHTIGPNYGVGGDSGDDIDGYDATDDIYWAQDNSGTTIGFSSAIVSDPITHYYSADYNDTYTWDEYKALYANDTWLYNRLRAPNAVVGVTPGNRSSTIGWDGFTLSPGTPRTITLVVAVNGTFNNMKNAIKDAQYFYHNSATSFVVTEFSDTNVAGQQKIEVYNNGREPTDLDAAGYKLSNDDGVSWLTGTWSPTIIPTYGYGVFTVTGTPIGPEGDSISFWQDPGGGYKLIDGPFDYGQEGIVPDPLDGDSVARYFDLASAIYKDDWLQTDLGGATWGSQNNVGYRITSGPVMLNRVMFNPFVISESYIEVSWRGIPIAIDNYRVTCDDEYFIPPGTSLSPSNPFFIINYSMAPQLFDFMDAAGDNVYLYNSAGNLLDMVGWTSPHTQGYYMGRVPDATGTTLGFNDTTSLAAGWVFDLAPTMMITEIAADGATAAQIEVYNPKGGDKTPTPGVWDVDCGAGTMTGGWSPSTVPAGGYSVFTQTGGVSVNLEGDTFSLIYAGATVVDSVGFGTNGLAPDPLTGESTGRYWDTGSSAYTGDWNRNASTGPTWGLENDVPAIDPSPTVILQEVMYDPSVDPDGHFLIIFNIGPFVVDITDWQIVCDDVFMFNQIWSTFQVAPFELWIFRYGDSTEWQPMFDSMDAAGDNVYMYDEFGQRIDMVGWDQPHFQGMSVKRVPDGNGTYQGYDDTSSTAAGWVFDSPLEVFLTEVSDDGGSSEIEVYNFWYPDIDFDGGGYAFENRIGATMTGNWIDSTAGAGEYAVLDVDPGFMDDNGDVVTFIQNNIVIDELGYGQYGTVPDPLDGESVQRYYDVSTSPRYRDHWARNTTTTGPNFGAVDFVPDDNFSSPIILNEVNFNPLTVGDFFIELYNRGGAPVNISGWKIVGDREYIIPMGTVLDLDQRYFYLLNAADPLFFDPANFNRAGDNIYLYNDAGSIVDMVGWSSIHTIGETMSRVPEGNGTRDGYDDTSSVAAGWRFGQTPTVRLISIEIEKDPTGGAKTNIQYGHFGSFVIFNLTISNFQTVGDTIDILNSSQEGWFVELLGAGGTVKIDDVFINADGTVNITVNITLPDSIPFAIMDNITIVIRSTNSTIIGDSISLNVRVYPFLNLTKSADPTTIYMNGTGHDEVTTITLNLTGLGAQVAVRRYLDVVFCIDSSGSMVWNDPSDLRKTESQNFVANYFEIPDRGAVVDFDLDAILVGNHHLSSNYPQIINDLNQIDSVGGTDLSNGLNLSNEEMAGWGQLTTKVPVIICITDAEITPPDDTESLAEADYAAAMGVIIMTIGLTIPLNGTSELLLKEIANRTGGMYYRADNPGFFASIFENISSFLTDLAVWDNDTADNLPLVRDVLPPYIRLYGNGNFTGPYAPTLINENGPGGTTIIEWNLQWIKLGETVTFTFEVVSNEPGYKMTNVVADSRAAYTRWDNSTEVVYFPEVWITVLPPSPIPPTLYIDTLVGGDDIYLWWDVPFVPGTEYYMLYQSTTPTGFDFSAPWIITNVDPDPIGGLYSKRLSWNHTGASDQGSGEWAEQYYYCLRSVNGLGEESYTSNTVGKWTRIFTAGTGTFSLPLEPLVPGTAENYTQDMNAGYIKWIDPGTRTWVQHDQGEIGDDTIMEVGKGYEVDFAAITKYTFLGHPGSMIRYKTDSTVGFDYATEADSLTASVNPATGDVTLTWAEPASMGPGDQYYVYSATARDGFHGTKGSDYQLVAINAFGNLVALDPGAATAGTQLYYIVIPVNVTGTEGASTYSIGVWTSDIMGQYDTISIPLRLTAGDQTADWYSTSIDNTVGINYFMYTDARWGWHSERMPSGAFDPTLIMTEGYQISTSGSTKYTFIGH